MSKETPAFKTSSPTVTIALSVLNGGSLLKLAVCSIVNQTFYDWELLILDDGSTDGAIEQLPFLDDPRIVLVRDGQNKGLSERLNQAIIMAKGRYFARMDHDDICHHERLAMQVAFLDANPHIDLLATECFTMDENEKLNGSLPSAIEHEAICARPWLGFPMPHPSWMGRIEWFRKHLYQSPGPYCCEDNELLLRAYRFSHYHTLSSYLLAYRVRTHTSWRKLYRTRIAMLNMQIKYFYQQKDLAALVLASAATLLRLGRDVWREVQYRIGFNKGSIFSEKDRECTTWSLLISQLKRQVSGNN